VEVAQCHDACGWHTRAGTPPSSAAPTPDPPPRGQPDQPARDGLNSRAMGRRCCGGARERAATPMVGRWSPRMAWRPLGPGLGEARPTAFGMLKAPGSWGASVHAGAGCITADQPATPPARQALRHPVGQPHGHPPAEMRQGACAEGHPIPRVKRADRRASLRAGSLAARGPDPPSRPQRVCRLHATGTGATEVVHRGDTPPQTAPHGRPSA